MAPRRGTPLEAFDLARVLGDDKDPDIVTVWVDRKNEEAGPLGVEGLGSPDNLFSVLKRDFHRATACGVEIVEVVVPRVPGKVFHKEDRLHVLERQVGALLLA